MFALNSTDMTMVSNTLSDNVATSDGGAVYIAYSRAMILEDNDFLNNQAKYLGGSICIWTGNVSIARFNFFTTSTAEQGSNYS